LAIFELLNRCISDTDHRISDTVQDRTSCYWSL